MLPRCGDGIQDPNEECDDGNNLDGDSCNLDCTLPRGAAPVYTAGVIPQGGQSSVTYGIPGGNQPVEIPTYQVPTPARQPTGPGLVIFLASGAAAGIGLVRRKLRGK
jgi:cysteine-rich repeat protein